VNVVMVVTSHEGNQALRPPLPAGYSRLYPRHAALPGQPDFQYVINTDVCGREDVNVVMVVTSHEGNQALRAAWRRLLTTADLERLGARRVFLLGRPSPHQAGYETVDESLVESESARYGDIVQGSFLESYRNLTLKHLMGLRWASAYCRQARYVVKMDDDIAVDVYQLVDKLEARYRPERLLLGLIHYDMRPVRDKTSKWYVPETEYNREFYRPFLSGWMYVASQDAVRRIVAAARDRPIFWIDDVHVTGTLAAAAGLKQSSLNSYYTPHMEHLECCARNHSLRCDYMVGPSEGDVALLGDFLGQARDCWVAHCPRRPADQALARTCVGTAKYAGRAAAVVRGTAEVVPVSWGRATLV